MKTKRQLRQEQRETSWGRLLVEYGLEPYDTESCARRVAERAAQDIASLRAQLKDMTDRFFAVSRERDEACDSIVSSLLYNTMKEKYESTREECTALRRSLAEQTTSLQQQLGEARKEVEQLRVQLAGCDVACNAGTCSDPSTFAKRGDYGWSPAYQRVLDTAMKKDIAETELTRLRAQQQSAGGEWAEAAARDVMAYDDEWERAGQVSPNWLRDVAAIIRRHAPHAPAIDEQNVRGAVEEGLIELGYLRGGLATALNAEKFLTHLRPLLGRNEEGKP